MKSDAHRVQENIRNAPTEDLLDRITVWQLEMEPTAVELIQQELRNRGVGQNQIEAHRTHRQASILTDGDTFPVKCSFCDRPAVKQGWGWHRLWQRVPIFPKFFSYCEHHRKPRS